VKFRLAASSGWEVKGLWTTNTIKFLCKFSINNSEKIS